VVAEAVWSDALDLRDVSLALVAAAQVGTSSSLGDAEDRHIGDAENVTD
jgi:hypothetical protein